MLFQLSNHISKFCDLFFVLFESFFFFSTQELFNLQVSLNINFCLMTFNFPAKQVTPKPTGFLLLGEVAIIKCKNFFLGRQKFCEIDFFETTGSPIALSILRKKYAKKQLKNMAKLKETNYVERLEAVERVSF